MSENGNGNGGGLELVLHEKLCEACSRPVNADGKATDNSYKGGKPCGKCRRGMLHLEATTFKSNDPSRPVGGRKRRKLVSEKMEEVLEQKVERILKPYLDVLELEPDEKWSPRTKLEFLQGQVSTIEKMINRVEGLPIARTRHVDENDNDVLPELDAMPAGQVQALLLGVLAGTRGAVIDGEAVEEP